MLGRGDGLADIAVVAHYDELIAAEASERISGPQAAREAVVQRSHDLVGGVRAERIIDRPEAIEVEEQHGQWRPTA